MRFSLWLEEQTFDFWKHLLTSYLELDRQNGLSQSLDGFDSESLQRRLMGLAEFAKLPQAAQKQALEMLKSDGTVGDLVSFLAGSSTI